jgi:transposase
MSKEITPTEYKQSLHQIVYRMSQLGLSQKDIAFATGYTQGNISHILQKIASQDSLSQYEVGHSSGRPANLDAEELELLKQELGRGAKAIGFPSEGWTRQRVHDFIQVRFKVDYSMPHISRLMKKLGYSLQEPEVVDTRRSSEQEACYEQKVLPELKKS